MMKKILLSLFIFTASFHLFCDTPTKPDFMHKDKKLLIQAKLYYDNKDYGEAINEAEKARIARKESVEWQIYTLENSFKPAEVKHVGTFLSSSIKILEDRQDYDALQIINHYKKHFGFDFFDDSKKGLLNYLRKIKTYPEAETLIANIYFLEGEYKIAQDYFTQAFEHADNLDIPDEKYDILYALANISLVQNDLEQYEKDLLLILAQDNAFKNTSLIKSMNRIINSNNKNSLEKFFSMYRSDNIKLLKAYFDLSEYYRTKKIYSKALETSSLCALTGFTKLIDVAEKRNPEFKYDGLASLLKEVSSYEDIVAWGIEYDVWKSFNNFAEDCYKNDSLIFAIELYKILKDYSPEEYWREQAEFRLKEITLG